MGTKENKPENQEPKKIIDEMIIEDLKDIESSSGLLLDALTEINRRAKQARQLLEIQVQDTKQSQIIPESPKTEPPNYYRNEQGGPWSRALSAMRDRADGKGRFARVCRKDDISRRKNRK